VKRNEHTGEFMAAFLAFGPAVELLKKVGRNVSGADFGHSTSPVFQGTYALGIHQTGSGAVLPVWAACFGGEWRKRKWSILAVLWRMRFKGRPPTTIPPGAH
jgi:hypothetical protein